VARQRDRQLYSNKVRATLLYTVDAQIYGAFPRRAPYSPNSTWLVTSRHDTTRYLAHAFWLCRACRTARLERSTHRTCRVWDGFALAYTLLVSYSFLFGSFPGVSSCISKLRLPILPHFPLRHFQRPIVSCRDVTWRAKWNFGLCWHGVLYIQSVIRRSKWKQQQKADSKEWHIYTQLLL